MDRLERFELTGRVGVNQQEGPPMERNGCTVGEHLLTSTERHQLAPTLCFCNALRQACRAVSRLYDEELRGVGLRSRLPDGAWSGLLATLPDLARLADEA
jgi:hypothetical protein